MRSRHSLRPGSPYRLRSHQFGANFFRSNIRRAASPSAARSAGS